MSAELMHVLFALAGAALGWFAKRHPQTPPELAELLTLLEPLLTQRKKDQAQGLLQELLNGLKSKPAGA